MVTIKEVEVLVNILQKSDSDFAKCAKQLLATIQQNDRLREALEDCINAMKRSQDEGSTTHLDCGEDHGEYWYNAYNKAKQALMTETP